MARHGTDAWTLRTRVLHFLYLFPINYLHNIFIITNHHRIIISKNSPATASVLSMCPKCPVWETVRMICGLFPAASATR